MSEKTASTELLGWDDPFREKYADRWQCRTNALLDLEKASTCHCYHPIEFGSVTRAEIHAFPGASQWAIGAAVYLCLFDANNEVAISLVFGQVKVAPINPVSILRLKLCRAVLAVQAVEKILRELNMMASEVTFNMDSRVVLGYIRNKSRRFYVYVANCMEFIGKILTPD